MYKKVLVLMSTYNGSEKIQRQIESILNQENVIINVFIRDDGSNKETTDILKKLESEEPEKIMCIYGSNVGYKHSFMDLLFSARMDYDYYAFSDQDDIWLSDKMDACIKLDDGKGPRLIHCNCNSVDENLSPRLEQENRIPCPPNHKAAIATEYFQGCGMVWNRELMELIKRYRPNNKDIAHDYWVGLIGYLFGKVYFCKEPKFYHIRYGNNESADGNVMKGRRNRLKAFFSGKTVYMNPTLDLLCGYEDMLSKEDKDFLCDLNKYKNNIKSKLKVLLDQEFRRESFISTLLFKATILMGRY